MNVRPPEDLKDFRSADAIKFDSMTADKYSDKGTVLHFALSLGYFPNTEEEAEELFKKMIRQLEWYETFVSLHDCPE